MILAYVFPRGPRRLKVPDMTHQRIWTRPGRESEDLCIHTCNYNDSTC